MKIRSVKTNALLNVVKQSCNIIFPLITYPYVSRVLGNTGLGKYSFSSSITSIAGTIAALGISTYAIREGARIRNDKDKVKQFSSELFSINIISMLITVVALVLLTLFVPRLNRNAVLTYILCVNIVTSVLGRDWVNTIYEDFFFVTIRYIVFQSIAVVLIFLFVRKPEDCIIYTAITVFGNSGGYIANIFHTKKYVPYRLTNKINIKKHIKPILYLFGVSLAIQMYVQSDITVLGFYRPDSEIGIYTIASKVYEIIKSLLSAVIMVVIPRLSNYLGQGKKDQYIYLTNKLRSSLYVIVFPCIVGLFFESRNVMQLIGGKTYVDGAIPLRILCIALGCAVFGCFYSQGVLVPNRRDKYYFIATIISALVNIGLNIVIIPFWGMAGAALTTVLAELIVVSICRKYSFDMISKGDLKEYISIGVGCSSIAVICFFTNSLKINYILQLIFAIILSIIAYTVLLIALKNRIILEAIETLKSKSPLNKG